MLLGQEIKLIITNINSKAEGIASYKNINIYVAKTVVGDEVIAKIYDKREGYAKAKLLEITKASPMRINPPCLYYDKCGGCNMQHFNHNSYLDFKQNIADEIAVDLTKGSLKSGRIFETGYNERRKLNLKINFDSDLKIGFYTELSHKVVDVKKCLIATDRINKLMPKLRVLLNSIKIKRILKEIIIYDLGHSFDIMLSCLEYLTKHDKENIRNFCEDNNVARFAQFINHEEIIFDNHAAFIEFANLKIYPPVNYFIQASRKIEEKIIEVIANNINHGDNVLELFAGVGTYSFSIYDKVTNITAYEGIKNMVMAAKEVISENQLKNVEYFYRDLFKKPLQSKEVAKYDVAIINPPRDGAKNQIIQISKSRIHKVIMVSCNPITFKRDSKIMLQNGFKISTLLPLDQFYANIHLEMVAVFEN